MAERSRQQHSRNTGKGESKIRSNKGSANAGPLRGGRGFEKGEKKSRPGRESREEGDNRPFRSKRKEGDSFRRAEGGEAGGRPGRTRGDFSGDRPYKGKKSSGEEKRGSRPVRGNREEGEERFTRPKRREEEGYPARRPGRSSGDGFSGDRPYKGKKSFGEEKRGSRPVRGNREEGPERSSRPKRREEEGYPARRTVTPGDGFSGDRPYKGKKSFGEEKRGSRPVRGNREEGPERSSRPKRREEEGYPARRPGKPTDKPAGDRFQPEKKKFRKEESTPRRSRESRDAGEDRIYRRKEGAQRGGEKPRATRGEGNENRGTEHRPPQNPKSGSKEKGKIRLNKAIADAGIVSRRKADEMIEAGQVRVNGNVVQELGTMVERSDRIEVNGQLIGNPDRERYILLNKPKDTITTTKDERGRQTVLDLIGARERLFPVGRLDRNTTGVLLLTNDGDLAYRLTHPSYEIERVYDVVLDKEISFADARAIAQGVPIGKGERSQPCYVSVQDSDRHNVTVVIREGKNREVRRMFESREYQVKKLNRVSYAGLTYQGLGRGEWRDLKRHEVRELRKRLKLE